MSRLLVAQGEVDGRGDQAGGGRGAGGDVAGVHGHAAAAAGDVDHRSIGAAGRVDQGGAIEQLDLHVGAADDGVLQVVGAGVDVAAAEAHRGGGGVGVAAGQRNGERRGAGGGAHGAQAGGHHGGQRHGGAAIDGDGAGVGCLGGRREGGGGDHGDQCGGKQSLVHGVPRWMGGFGISPTPHEEKPVGGKASGKPAGSGEIHPPG